ncbi:hypothetical protein [Flavobacterium aurantiibacter]|uniref:Uncharacterized protein n=1 Tax=Flavobacterium aurantiibacter TaxID=2023067 RepID=A0A256AFR7_9FLAO|nr:hypothetical protein [Flavobacterium aurantiibacter]OYQ52572.1 hypothetical protein CHX27_00025 [Flavobacterium aurantiibacter]
MAIKSMIPQTICIFIFLCFASCKNQNDQELLIHYQSYQLYLSLPENADAKSPPILNLAFKVKNLTDREVFFASKGNEYDDIKSKLYLLDTLNNKKYLFYSNNINFLKPNEEITIIGTLEIREHKNLFGLDEAFFNKLNFKKDSLLLSQKAANLINRCEMYYCQEKSDIQFFKLQNENVTSLIGNLPIKIERN